MTDSHRTIPFDSLRSLRASCAAVVEAHDIHMATCRARRQGLVCSLCAELVVRVVRALEAA